MTPAERTPVLIGIGLASCREDDPTRALEPMDLMHTAVAAAGRDAGHAAALSGVQYIAVPRGRWTYRNPAGEIATRIGAPHATTVLSSVGVLQQSLLGEACARIARGEAHTTLVTGADAGYRLLRAQLAGVELRDRDQNDDPDVFIAPKDELRHPVELRAGLKMPVGLYAMMESAYRARQAWSLDEHRDRLAALYARFSTIAATNPHAWHRESYHAAQIRTASPHNPMQAFPYTRLHVSTWNVDQAAALLFCSAARAEALGIPRARWIYALASSESNHMVPVSARADLSSCPGARITAQAALHGAQVDVADLNLIELYSCFPVAVETYAEALGLSLERDLTVTGGMPFAGGPYNNYVLQASARAAELLRAGSQGTALVGSVSGVLTKQGFGLWSTLPATRPFVHADVSREVAPGLATCEVLDGYHGAATVAGYTVLHGRDQTPRGVALLNTPTGQRVLATSDETNLVATMQSEEWVGRTLRIAGTSLMWDRDLDQTRTGARQAR